MSDGEPLSCPACGCTAFHLRQHDDSSIFLYCRECGNNTGEVHSTDPRLPSPLDIEPIEVPNSG